MVAMQDRIGLSSGLIDVANSGLNAADKGAMWSAEQWRRAQREWKNRRAGAGKNTTTGTAEEGSTREKEKEKEKEGGTYPYGGQQRGGMRGGMEEDEGMVGSEVFDDENGLAGVLSPEEREKARREQMAWDEKKKKKKSQEVERRVSSAAAAAAVPVRSTMGTRDDDDEGRRRQTMVRWEEKPKVVYA